VGSVAIQVAKIMGGEVWGLCSSKNVDYAKQLGADKVLNYQTTQLEAIPEKFDVVFDVACNSTFSISSKILTPQGHYFVLLPTPAFMIGFLQSLFSPKACRFLGVQSKKKDLDQITAWVEAGRLKPCVSSTLNFNEVPQAFDLLGQQSPRGKIAFSFEF
jgi:NADPH:quinone reductase-like Zn-dependent oxidoreductase